MKRKINTVLQGCLLVGLALPAYASGSVPVADESLLTHRMMLLALQLGVIIFSAKLGGLLFRRFKLPGVLGELLAGVLIGPYFLGAVTAPGIRDGLFPLVNTFPISPELYGICTVAAILLLFMVGLETDVKMFMRFSLAGSVIGVGGVVLSFWAGNLTMVLLGDLFLGQTYAVLDPQPLFLGVISTATSIGITARILEEKKALSSPEGTTILTGAVVDDVLGIIVLAVVLGTINASRTSGGIDWSDIGQIALKAGGIWLGATFIGLYFSRRISLLLKWFREPVSIAIMALGVALLVAGLFEEAGLAMIIGAFVAGLSLSQTDISRVIQEQLEGVQELLVPIFFCSMGMLVDPRAFLSLPLLTFGLIYTLVAVIAKLAGCGLPALWFGFNLRGALRIGTGMVPRGEVALIIAGIGLATGALDHPSFSSAIIMTLLTTLIAPIGLTRLFQHPAPGTTRALPAETRMAGSFEFPSPEITRTLFGLVVDEFRRDGFYVHAVTHGDRHRYQIRKDRIKIDFVRTGQLIHYTCEKHDEHIVNAAVYEKVAELRSMLDGLNKPIDEAALQQRLLRSSRHAGRPLLDIADYVRPQHIQPDLKAQDKEGVIRELLDLLLADGTVSGREQLLHALLAREKIMSTGLQDGLALPHIKTDRVNKIVCAIGIQRNGIDFGSLDGKLSRIFVLELAPSQLAGPHLQFVSSVTQTIQTLRDQLLQDHLTADALHRLLTRKP